MSQPATTLQDTSSPQYFVETFKVSPAEAASLSAQARAADSTRGGGLTTEAPGRGPVAPPPAPVAGFPPTHAAFGAAPPAPAAMSARAEYEQLMADRASGKITNAQWTAFGREREAALANQIADGRGAHVAQPAPTRAVDPFDQHFAPPSSADEYQLPRPASGQMTDAEAAADRAFRNAVHAEQLPRSVVESIASSVNTAISTLANETPEQLHERLADNRTRLTAMWAKSGEGTFDDNMRIVDRELDRLCRNPTLRRTIEGAARFFTPLDIDAILQLAKHRAARS